MVSLNRSKLSFKISIHLSLSAVSVAILAFRDYEREDTILTVIFEFYLNLSMLIKYIDCVCYYDN